MHILSIYIYGFRIFQITKCCVNCQEQSGLPAGLETVVSAGKEVCVKVEDVFDKVVVFVSHRSHLLSLCSEVSINQEVVVYLPKARKK